MGRVVTLVSDKLEDSGFKVLETNCTRQLARGVGKTQNTE